MDDLKRLEIKVDVQNNIVITDHALVRYLEREYNFNATHFRREMRCKIGQSYRPNCNIDGFIIGKKGAVITYIPKEVEQK